MNPSSLQKPASIKDFCDIFFYRYRVVMRLARKFFCSRHARTMVRGPSSGPKIFFSQAGPGGACEGRFKFGFERIGAALIRMRETPDRVCMRRRCLEEGSARRFAPRVIAPGAGVAPDTDENLHRDDLPARVNHDERRSRCP
jgi:hypothetical protein